MERWIKNLDFKWKKPNVKISEPIQKDFVGKDIVVVEKHETFMKMTLMTMGIQDVDDQNSIIQKIKILIKNDVEDGENATDVWDKTSDSKPKLAQPGWE